MANVSFEAQPFLPAAAGSIHLGPNPRSSGHSEFDPILIPSDDESDYGISDDGDSDTTFPSVDEIFARLRKVGSDSDLGAKRPRAAVDSDSVGPPFGRTPEPAGEEQVTLSQRCSPTPSSQSPSTLPEPSGPVRLGTDIYSAPRRFVGKSISQTANKLPRASPVREDIPQPASSIHVSTPSSPLGDGISQKSMLCRNLASEAQKESDGGGEAGRAASHSGPATQRVRFASAGGADSDDEDATQHQDKDGEPRDSDARPPPYKRRKSNFSIPAFQVRATGTPTRSGSIDISSRGPGKENIGASIAESEEYPLRSAVLKCVTASGVATFHLEFSLDLCGGQGNGDHVQGQHRNSPAKKHSSSSICSTLNGYTAEEDEFLKQLKERHELPWKEIHRQFIQAFPRKNRSVPALQVRYCTKLKGSQPGSCQ